MAMTIKIRDWNDEDQIYPSVEMGLVPPELPKLEMDGDLEDEPINPPPELIKGVLHKGCKMVLGGTSKSNKSWCLLDLAVSVASGTKWWDMDTAMAKAVYVNFELPRWALRQRLLSIKGAKPHVREACRRNLALWNLRGHNTDMTLLRPQLDAQLEEYQPGLIILDPAYKLLGDRDENSNGDIAGLFNEFEALAKKHGAAVVLAHHFAKGDSTLKQAMDRMSGAGAWVRDPDAILVMTPHEEVDCFTVTPILRNLPKRDDFVVRWDFPLMRLADGLNPAALRTPQSGNKRGTDAEFMQAIFTNEDGQLDEEITTHQAEERAGKALHLSGGATRNRLTDLRKDGWLVKAATQPDRVFRYRKTNKGQ
jgi:hypothetical protein